MGIDMEVVSLVAIFTSPLFAVLISVGLQNRSEKRKQKIWLFHALIATRHTPVNDESVRAYNMIDVVFFDKKIVRKFWQEYFDMLNNAGLNNENGNRLRTAKQLELITEMAKVLGYGKEITSLDVDRVYYPEGLLNTSRRSEELANELLRVLKASKGFALSPTEAEEKK